MYLRDVLAGYVGRDIRVISSKSLPMPMKPLKFASIQDDHIQATDSNGLPYFVPYASITTMMANANGLLQIFVS